VTKDEQLTLNEIIRDKQRLTAQDFTTLIILYMSANLLFLEANARCRGILWSKLPTFS